eukprot:CCRYP_004842-RD/>CCRYP_004842-RD protein AED:0.40 eAED:0.31 QI:0/-1/0/1/-1/0/1/0/72
MELGHKQPATPIQTDNPMAEAVTNGKVQPKRTKAMDMRFHDKTATSNDPLQPQLSLSLLSYIPFHFRAPTRV